MLAHRVRSYVAFLSVLSASLVLAGCTFTVFASKENPDPEAEAHYRAVWSEHAKALVPLNHALDVCNIGGSRQGCYEASAQMITELSAFVDDLRSTKVPPRYKKADALTREGLSRLKAGFERRNRGLASNDNADFVGGNQEIKEADAILEEAHARFPPDARP
jgi:hypothetical protein